MWAQRWQFQCRNIYYTAIVLSHHYKKILQLFKCSRRFSGTLLAVFYKLVNAISRIQQSLGRPNNIFLKNTPIIECLEAISIRFIRLFS